MTIMPKRIYLFGSFAKDTYNEDSDYDFYIVVPDDAGNKIELSQKAYKSLRGVRKRPVDIVVGYESSFDERAKENTLEKVVKQEGVLLYEKWKNFKRVDEKYLEMCDDLTPYGVKIRYPQELFIEEYHVKKALEETQKLYDWLLTLLQTEKRDSEEWEKWVRVENYSWYFSAI